MCLIIPKVTAIATVGVKYWVKGYDKKTRPTGILLLCALLY